MPYYGYQGGFCGYCGESLGYIDQAEGRMRQYCNDVHKKAASRKRLKTVKRDEVLSQNKILQDYWRDNGIEGELLFRLQDILLDHGKEAAKAATDACLLSIQQTREKYAMVKV